jgi:hypothetical protein
MTPRSRRVAGWSAGAAVGVVAGVLLGMATHNWQEAREARDIDLRAEEFARTDVVPPPGDAVRALVEQDALVAVDPLLVDRVPGDDVRRAEAILEDASVPARIAYLAYPDTNDVGYTSSGAPVQWSTAVGEEGHYVVLWDNGGNTSVAVGLEPPYVETLTEGQPGPALVRIAAEMAAWEAEPLPTAPDEPSDFDYYDGVGGGIAAALLYGALGVVPAFLLLRWFVGSRRREVA